jgi:hypothetical protein
MEKDPLDTGKLERQFEKFRRAVEAFCDASSEASKAARRFVEAYHALTDELNRLGVGERRLGGRR